MMKRFLGLSAILALGLLLVVPAPASAVLLISGESELHAFALPSAFIRVDWQVFSPGDGPIPIAGFFEYVYQIEVTTGDADAPAQPNDVGSFTITFNPGLPFTAAGFIAGNLVIGSEVNPNSAGSPALTCCVDPTSTSPLPAGVVTWTFDLPKIGQSGQSSLLVGISPNPPSFGNAGALDGAPGSPWGTLAPGSQQVPIPGVPEPSTMLLLATGLVGLVIRKRI